jgi:hypothetical protein
MFHLPLKYDEVASNSRMNPITRGSLKKLFTTDVGDPENRHIRVQTGTASRSAIYVLNEGVVDSPHCFSVSRYKKPAIMWITPVSCSYV